MEYPKEIRVQIEPEIVKGSGNYTDSLRCPLATFFRINYPPPEGKRWFAFSDKVVLVPKLVKGNTLTLDDITNTYRLNDYFLSKDLEQVKRGKKFTTLAVLEEPLNSEKY